MVLKYLFSVEYKDGSRFNQNKEDISSQDEKRSAFFDVCQEEVVRFNLHGGGFLVKDKFTVDLTDGHFEVMGVPFFMHDRALPLKDFKLIFHRKHTHQFNMAGDKPKELSHEIDFCIGWKAVDEGDIEHERILEVR